MTGKRKMPQQVTGPPYKTRKEEGVALKRPKRQVISKNVDQSAGLSWREETELKKALYASLQESKRLSRGQEDDDDDDDEVVISPRSRSQGRHHRSPGPRAAGHYGGDDSSQDSMRTVTSSSTQESKKMTVHAQRKFAQGQSQPSTPSTTPIKTLSTPVKLFSKRAKTEDFLTFLCLRGSSVLPPHLDFFGYSRDDSTSGENRSSTPGRVGRSDSGETRESTPDLTSSSDSDMTYEVPDLAALVMKNQQTPTRKAARASASTPETARGLVSIRTGINKKGGKFPAKALLKQSKTLLASPTKMSPRGKRALLRHQRSPSKPVRVIPSSVDLCTLPVLLPLSVNDMNSESYFVRQEEERSPPCSQNCRNETDKTKIRIEIENSLSSVDCFKLGTTEHQSNVSTTEHQSNVSTTEHQSNVSTTEHQSNVSTTEHQSNVSTTEHQSNVSTTGHVSHLSTKERNNKLRTVEFEKKLSLSECENNRDTNKSYDIISTQECLSLMRMKWCSFNELNMRNCTSINSEFVSYCGSDVSCTAPPSDVLDALPAPPGGGLFPCSRPIAHASQTPLPSPPFCVIKALEDMASVNHCRDSPLDCSYQRTDNNPTHPSCSSKMYTNKGIDEDIFPVKQAEENLTNKSFSAEVLTGINKDILQVKQAKRRPNLTKKPYSAEEDTNKEKDDDILKDKQADRYLANRTLSTEVDTKKGIHKVGHKVEQSEINQRTKYFSFEIDTNKEKDEDIMRHEQSDDNLPLKLFSTEVDTNNGIGEDAIKVEQADNNLTHIPYSSWMDTKNGTDLTHRTCSTKMDGIIDDDTFIFKNKVISDDGNPKGEKNSLSLNGKTAKNTIQQNAKFLDIDECRFTVNSDFICADNILDDSCPAHIEQTSFDMDRKMANSREIPKEKYQDICLDELTLEREFMLDDKFVDISPAHGKPASVNMERTAINSMKQEQNPQDVSICKLTQKQDFLDVEEIQNKNNATIQRFYRSVDQNLADEASQNQIYLYLRDMVDIDSKPIQMHCPGNLFESMGENNQGHRGYFQTRGESVELGNQTQNPPSGHIDCMVDSKDIKQIFTSGNIEDSDESSADNVTSSDLEFPPLRLPLTADIDSVSELDFLQMNLDLSSELSEEQSNSNSDDESRSIYYHLNQRLENSLKRIADLTLPATTTVNDTIYPSESSPFLKTTARGLAYPKSLANPMGDKQFEHGLVTDVKNSFVSRPAPLGRPFLYPLPPALCSSTVEKSKSTAGYFGKGGNSKPVRASATPSKKRITPQSLPIGSLPKFYIDDSDSSVQSRDLKEIFVNRRGKSEFAKAKKGKPLRMKLQTVHLKRNFKNGNSSKPAAKLAGKTSVSKSEKKFSSKVKGNSKMLSAKTFARQKERTGAVGTIRKKRMAAMAKNYAEDHDDDLEGIDDLEPVDIVPVSKPLKRSFATKKVNNKGESRRKIVAASLAKMTAAKKLSQIKKTANKKKLKQNISGAILKKSQSITKLKSKASKREFELKSSQKEGQSSSPPSTPKRRGRPRSTRISSSPCDKTDNPVLFPSPDDSGQIVEVPTFRPTSKEFQDPLNYIALIRQTAEPYGMCRVVPPASWKPECKVNEELRFTSQLQYIHKLQNRWGPNVQQMECIRKHLASINVDCEQPPLIGGIEVDLPKLHQTIQVFGGAQNVAEKKTWIKVADAMKIPKLAQDRATKLYDAYCKYLLSYDTLSYEEKTKLEQQVRNERQKRIKSQNMPDDSVVKGRSTSLGDFTRVARNTVSMWFKEDPTVEQVECEYWKLIQDGQSHVVVQCGHVDTRAQGSAFPVRRDSPCARHGWNFNVLTQNPSSVLKTMGPVTGVTTPTLHIGMLFTTSCWSTDLHRLPYIQYLHAGSDTAWYSVPKSEERKFKKALSTIVPELVKDETTWLAEDTVMVSPDSLSQKGVSLGRCTQRQGEFMVVFSHCHTATLSCGYSISESVHYAYADWITDAVGVAKQLNGMAEPELFSMEGFLCNTVKETTNLDTLSIALPQLKQVIEEECVKVDQLIDDGLKSTKQMCASKDLSSNSTSGVKRRSLDSVNKDDSVCDVCKKICHLFVVTTDAEDTLCLDHAAGYIQRKKNLKGYQLLYRYSQEELSSLLGEAEKRLGDRVTFPEKTMAGPRRRSSNLRSIQS